MSAGVAGAKVIYDATNLSHGLLAGGLAAWLFVLFYSLRVLTSRGSSKRHRTAKQAERAAVAQRYILAIAWSVLLAIGALGTGLIAFAYGRPSRITVHGTSLELAYAWPRPPMVFPHFDAVVVESEDASPSSRTAGGRSITTFSTRYRVKVVEGGTSTEILQTGDEARILRLRRELDAARGQNTR